MLSIKILEINPEEINQKLLQIGSHKIFSRLLTKTLMFDHPLLRLRTNGKVLRLRQVGRKVFLSIKAGQENAPTSPFHKIVDSELELNDFNQAFQLFEGLGFSAFRYQEKLRSGYTFSGGIEIELDEYPKIPPYLEVSAPDQAVLDNFINRLNLPKDRIVKMSATEILRHYGLKDVDIIRFPDTKLPGEREGEN